MQRLIIILCTLIGIAILVQAGLTYQNNPIIPKRAAFNKKIAAVEPESVIIDFENKSDFTQLRANITGNKNLWQELIKPPPPPPPPPPKPPNINKNLQGVSATRQGIGDKVIFKIPGNPRARYGVGDVHNGCTIKEITRTDVLFVLPWTGGEVEARIPRK